MKAPDARKVEAAIARLRERIDSYASFAAKGEVREMLHQGVMVQEALEQVAKVVTGTEIPT